MGPMRGNRLKMQEKDNLIQKVRFSLEKWKRGSRGAQWNERKDTCFTINGGRKKKKKKKKKKKRGRLVCRFVGGRMRGF